MEAAAEYRFTDRDVRENPDLADTAFQFAYNYGGDFDFLVHAHTYALEHGRLHTAMARGVLNCMRSDLQGLALLHRLIPVSNIPPMPHRVRILHAVEKQRPAYIDLPSEWHYDYIMSLNKMAQVVHILDRQRSHVRWYPHMGTFEFDLYICKPIFRGQRYQMVYEDPEGRRLCPQCQKRTYDNLLRAQAEAIDSNVRRS